MQVKDEAPGLNSDEPKERILRSAEAKPEECGAQNHAVIHGAWPIPPPCQLPSGHGGMHHAEQGTNGWSWDQQRPNEAQPEPWWPEEIKAAWGTQCAACKLWNGWHSEGCPEPKLPSYTAPERRSDGAQPRWRLGTQTERTLYRRITQDGRDREDLVGFLDEEIASEVVHLLNQADERRRESAQYPTEQHVREVLETELAAVYRDRDALDLALTERDAELAALRRVAEAAENVVAGPASDFEGPNIPELRADIAEWRRTTAGSTDSSRKAEGT
jgi:hypothetical protein